MPKNIINPICSTAFFPREREREWEWELLKHESKINYYISNLKSNSQMKELFWMHSNWIIKGIKMMYSENNATVDAMW